MGTNLKLDDAGTDPGINEIMYRGIIGSLLYLTTSRPDIVFSVGMCAKFQTCPKKSHLKAAKRILRYLKKPEDLVIFYPSGDSFDLVGYTYEDYVRFQVDRKSTSGMEQLKHKLENRTALLSPKDAEIARFKAWLTTAQSEGPGSSEF
ncbi:secreted RxLR effector protein 161-like [Solanum dulcamara]|uniref:secreted RxLR effector protein 161-like n=1 Tax=Solanum dulcamara TaxID=45834 RepID=UPI0024858D39|nr:secreted RxLR effector protein 161-like [Solanum dulcamara]